MQEWVWQQRLTAYKTNNKDLITAFQLHDQAWSYCHTDTAQMVAYLRQALSLAAAQGSPCLVMYFQNELCRAHITYSGNYGEAYMLAVRMIVTASKHPTCPIIHAAYLQAISTLLVVDPVGFGEQLAEMITYVENFNLPPNTPPNLMIYERALLAYALDDFAGGFALLQRYADQNPHFYGALKLIGYAHYLREEWDLLQYYAEQAEQAARQAHNAIEIAQALYWQALCAYRRGDTRHGDDFFSGGEIQRQTIEQNVRPFYKQLGWLYLQRGEGNHIPTLMQTVIAILQRGGEYYSECAAWLSYLQFLQAQGYPLAEVATHASTAAANLRQPALFLAKIEAVLQGESVKMFWL